MGLGFVDRIADVFAVGFLRIYGFDVPAAVAALRPYRPLTDMWWKVNCMKFLNLQCSSTEYTPQQFPNISANILPLTWHIKLRDCLFCPWHVVTLITNRQQVISKFHLIFTLNEVLSQAMLNALSECLFPCRGIGTCGRGTIPGQLAVDTGGPSAPSGSWFTSSHFVLRQIGQDTSGSGVQLRSDGRNSAGRWH